MVVFAQHNVIKDAPFTRVDLISCRNLLIYLQPPAQQKVLSLFHFALNRGGVLFLGPERDARARWRTDSRPSTSTGASTASTATCACRSTRGSQPSRRPSRASPRAPRSRPAARYSLSQLLGTYDALLERGHAAEPAGQRPRRARPRVRRREPVPAACATGARASTCSTWSTPSCKMVLVGGLKRALQRAGADRLQAASASGRRRRARRTRSRSGACASRSGGAPHLLVSFEPIGAAHAGRPPRRDRDRPRPGLARAARRARGRAAPHQGEPAGGDRGARDQQRGAAGRERGAARLERGAAEHQRGAAERQRGALHGQRRVPAQDRAS